MSFLPSTKPRVETLQEKRKRIMSEISTKLEKLDNSKEKYDTAKVNLKDWQERVAVIESRVKGQRSSNLLFLQEQAHINLQLAQEEYDRQDKVFSLTKDIRKEAMLAMQSLDRISLSVATQQAARQNRNINNQAARALPVSSVHTETQRELQHAEYYLNALTELTMEK